MRSHRDGRAGRAQFGLTLRGRRVLRLGVHRSPVPGLDPNVWDDEAWPQGLVDLVLEPGDVYVARPELFEHAVAYDPLAPSVALMYRAPEAVELERLRVPSLKQVKAEMQR